MFGGKILQLRKPATVLLCLSLGLTLLITGCGKTATPAAPATHASHALSPADQLAAKQGYVLVGMVAPLTGPIASFGESINWVMQKLLKDINKDGGIYIKSLGKKLPLKVKLVDSQSSPSVAAQVATELITKDKVAMVFAMWAPLTVDPVTGICERYHVPCLGMGSEEASWLPGGPYHWSYATLMNLNTTCQLNMGLWNSEGNKTNKVVGFIFGNDADGIAWAKFYNKELPQHGFTVVDPGRFPDDNNDFTAIINLFKEKHVEIVKGSVPPNSFAVFWRQCREAGYVPKMCDVSEADLFPSDVQAFGDNLGLGLTTETFWGPFYPTKSSLTGETSQHLCDDWTKATGKEWNQTLGQDYTAFELMNDILKRTQSLSPQDIRTAMAQTNLKTIGWVTPITFNSQHVSNGPVVTGQWVHGKKWPWELQVVYTSGLSGFKTHPLIFPLPKS